MLHCGQYSKRLGLIALWAQRLPEREFELFRFGTAMASYLQTSDSAPWGVPRQRDVSCCKCQTGHPKRVAAGVSRTGNLPHALRDG